MTSESLASARALLAELKATQAYLRATAARALPYPALLSVERRAQKRCAELLTALGVELGASPPATEPVVISLAGGGEPPAAPVRTSPTGAVRTPVRTRTLTHSSVASARRGRRRFRCRDRRWVDAACPASSSAAG